jgi:hypothetical protein
MRKRTGWIVHLAGIAALGAALASGGCDAISLKGADADAGALEGDAWPFRPAAMRIHPFTAIERDEEAEALVLEARVELRDQLGDTTKGVGDFRFELYAREPEASQQGERRRLAVWDAPLQTLEQNRRHYDPVTHSYLFRLRLPQRPPEDRRLELLAQFSPRRGQRLMAGETVDYEPGEDEEAGQGAEQSGGEKGGSQEPVQAEGAETAEQQ